jgi:hypothetical protein
MNLVPLALYAVALVAYAWHFAQRNPVVGRSATTLLVAAALSHTFVIGMQTMEAGHVPMTWATSAISTFGGCWRCLPALEMTPTPAGDGRVHPAAARGAAGDSGVQPQRRRCARCCAARSSASRLVAALRLCDFALACVVGITYVLLFKGNQGQAPRLHYARLPSLSARRMNRGAIVISWIFRPSASSSARCGRRRRAAATRPGIASGDVGADPKIFVALVCWLVYSFELFAARRIGWSGRRAAYLSAVGF